jgi:(p)ppGpp synthase/HD superfamily hydrolase
MHGPLIQRTSEVERLSVPSTVDELAAFVKKSSKTQYRDIDDLFMTVGRHHDRTALYNVVADLFGLSKKILAEEKRDAEFPGSIYSAVQERRRKSMRDEAAASDKKTQETLGSRPNVDVHSLTNKHSNAWDGLEGSKPEYADIEHICELCLPVYGDQIIGTKPPGDDSTVTVHRIGCPHAQRAMNQAEADQKLKSLLASIQTSAKSTLDPRPRVDSTSLRQRNTTGKRFGGGTAASKYAASTTKDLPLPLQWSDLDDNTTLFMAEVLVHAQDRKLLLADCSEIVSKTAEIVRTGSSSSHETASLVFLVKVGSLEQLQYLMDQLGMIKSVMSVERQFGSDLL